VRVFISFAVLFLSVLSGSDNGGAQMSGAVLPPDPQSPTESVVKLAQRLTPEERRQRRNARHGRRQQAGERVGDRSGGAASQVALPASGTIRATLLGTGGGPGGGGPGLLTQRMNSTVLVEAADQVLLFDVGRGTVIRLAQMGQRYFQAIDKVFITHLHSDHVTDLPDLFLSGPNLGRRGDLKVWGPTGTAGLVDHVKRAFAWDLNYRTNPRRGRPEMIAEEVVEGVIYEGSGVKVTVFQVDHWPPRESEASRDRFPAVGYRVDYNGRSVAISGDTRFSRNLVKFSKGANVVIHEVHVGLGLGGTMGPRDRQRGSHHTSPQDVGRVFKETGTKLGVFYHIVFGRSSEEDLLRLARETYDGPMKVGKELMQIVIGDEVSVTERN